MARRVLVTAGAGEIGKEIARAFLAAGDAVYTCDINSTALAAAAEEMPGLKTGVCDVGGSRTRRHSLAAASTSWSTTPASPARPLP